jgi:alpha-N-arabinofuranosidase
MPTFGEWERTVLEHAYEDVDYISAHAYYEEDQDLTSFLASGANMDHFIKTVTTAADHVQAHKGSDKRIDISFDEWNVWSITKWEAQQKTFTLDEWPTPSCSAGSSSRCSATQTGSPRRRSRSSST